MGAPMNRHSDQVVNDIPARYFLVLGAAAADLWSELPQELQHQLFEHAVVLGHQGEQDESLREQLAKFLHDHHERTLARWGWPIKVGAVRLGMPSNKNQPERPRR